MSTYVDHLNDTIPLPDGWEFVESDALICPHLHTVELDGECPDGCESPLLMM